MSKNCKNCLKTVVILLNLIFLLVGCFVLILSVYIYKSPDYNSLIHDDVYMGKIRIVICLLMGLSGTTILLGSLGFCGAYQENLCLLGTYFVIVFIIIAGQMIGAILGFIYGVQIEESISATLKKGADKYIEDRRMNIKPSEDVLFMDTMHQFLKCCGWKEGFKDFCTSDGACPIPISCCKHDNETCQSNSRNDGTLTQPENAYEIGCGTSFTKFFHTHSKRIFIFVLCISIVEMIGLLTGLILFCTIKHQNVEYIGVDNYGD